MSVVANMLTLNRLQAEILTKHVERLHSQRNEECEFARNYL